MSSKLRLTIGGRPASMSDFGKRLKDQGMRLAQDGIVRRLEAVRCSVHGDRPRNIRVSNASGKLTFSFTACCDGLRTQVASELR